MDIVDTFTLIREILLGVAAATTAVVAVLGLKSWRSELTGRAEFETARQLMNATYRLREELANCRAPFVSAAEFPQDYNGPTEASAEEEARAWSYVHQNRWDPVRAALEELASRALEAEALWGQEIRKRTEELRQCAIEIRIAMDAIVDNKAQRGLTFEEDKEFGRRMMNAARASRSDDGNELSKKIGAAIAAIEEHVRPHLRRS